MKRVEFRPGDLSDKAFEEYSGSDFKFFLGADGLYYIENLGYEKVGTLQDVEDLLLAYSE